MASGKMVNSIGVDRGMEIDPVKVNVTIWKGYMGGGNKIEHNSGF